MKEAAKRSAESAWRKPPDFATLFIPGAQPGRTAADDPPHVSVIFSLSALPPAIRNIEGVSGEVTTGMECAPASACGSP